MSRSFLMVTGNLTGLLSNEIFAVRDLQGVPVEQLAQGVASGDGAVKDPEELGTNISRDTGVPRRIKPENTPPPAPVLSPTPIAVAVVVVELVNVDLLVFKHVVIPARPESFLVLWPAFIKDCFIAR